MQRSQIKKYIASPLNYIGGKARILDQLLPHMPADIDTFVDLFCGGCNVGMNVEAAHTVYNDISKPLIGLLRTFERMENKQIVDRINALIDEFGFSKTRHHSFSYYGGDANLGVSVYNRGKYLKLRERFNAHPVKDEQYYILLYTLILFGFNNQLRFNGNDQFNLPVGKRDFNTTIEAKLVRFLDALRLQSHEFHTRDFRDFDFGQLTERSLVYCDPPYLITTATYNEKAGWTRNDEHELTDLLDVLNEQGVRFALSNVLEHESKRNDMLQEWIDRNDYRVHDIFMDYHYSNYQKKSKKAESREVLITNY